MPRHNPKIMGTLYSDQVKIEFQHLDVYNNNTEWVCESLDKKKTKIEIIAGNEDNLMFSQANGKREKFIVFFDSTRVFFFCIQTTCRLHLG